MNKSFSKILITSIFMILFAFGSLFAQSPSAPTSNSRAIAFSGIEASASGSNDGKVKIAWSSSQGQGRVVLQGTNIDAVKAAMSALGANGVINLAQNTTNKTFSTFAVKESVESVFSTGSITDITPTALVGNLRTLVVTSLAPGDYAFGVLDFARVGNEIIFYNPNTNSTWNLGTTNPRLVNIPTAAPALATAPVVTTSVDASATMATVEFTGLLRNSAVEGGDYIVNIVKTSDGTPVSGYPMVYALEAGDFSNNKFEFDVYGLEAGTAYTVTVAITNSGEAYTSAPVSFTTSVANTVSTYSVKITEGEGGLATHSENGSLYINEKTKDFYVTFTFYSDANALVEAIMDLNENPEINIACAASAASGDITEFDSFWEGSATYTVMYKVKDAVGARSAGDYTFTVISAVPEGGTSASNPSLAAGAVNVNVLPIDNVKPTVTSIEMESDKTTSTAGATCEVKVVDATLEFVVTFSEYINTTGITSANLLKFYDGDEEIVLTGTPEAGSAAEVLKTLMGTPVGIEWSSNGTSSAKITWTFPDKTTAAEEYEKTLKTLANITVKVDEALVKDQAGNEMNGEDALNASGTLKIERSVPKITSIVWDGNFESVDGKNLLTENEADKPNLTLKITFDEAMDVNTFDASLDIVIYLGDDIGSTVSGLTLGDGSNGAAAPAWASGNKELTLTYLVDRTATYTSTDPVNVRISDVSSSLGNKMNETTSADLAGSYTPFYFDVVVAPTVSFSTSPVNSDNMSDMSIALTFGSGVSTSNLYASNYITLAKLQSASATGELYEDDNAVEDMQFVSDVVSLGTSSWSTNTCTVNLLVSNNSYLETKFGNVDAKNKLYRFEGAYKTLNGRDVKFVTDGKSDNKATADNSIRFYFISPEVVSIKAIGYDNTIYTLTETNYINRATTTAYFLVEFSENVKGVAADCFDKIGSGLDNQEASTVTAATMSSSNHNIFTASPNTDSKYWIVSWAKDATANSTPIAKATAIIKENSTAASSISSSLTNLTLNISADHSADDKPYQVDCASPVMSSGSKIFVGTYDITGKKLYANAGNINLRIPFSEEVNVLDYPTFKLGNENLTISEYKWYTDNTYTTVVTTETHAKYLEVTFALTGDVSTSYKFGGVTVIGGEYTITAYTAGTNNLTDVAGNALATSQTSNAYAANTKIDELGEIKFTFKDVPRISNIAVKDLNNNNISGDGAVSEHLKPTFSISADPAAAGDDAIVITAYLLTGDTPAVRIGSGVTLAASGTDYSYTAGTVSFTKDLKEIFGSTWEDITAGTNFKLEISATDTRNNTHSDTSVIWKKHDSKPTITGVTTPANQSTIAPNGLTSLVVDLNYDLKAVSGVALSDGDIKLVDINNVALEVKIPGTYVATDRHITITIAPSITLAAGTTYKLVIKENVFEDKLGNQNQKFDSDGTWTLKTTAAPKITGVKLYTDDELTAEISANHFYKASDVIYAKVIFDQEILVSSDLACSLTTNIKKSPNGATTATLQRTSTATALNYLLLTYEVASGDVTGTAYTPGTGEVLTINNFTITSGNLTCSGIEYTAATQLSTASYGTHTAKVDAVAPKVAYNFADAGSHKHTINGKNFIHYRPATTGVGLKQANTEILALNLTEHNSGTYKAIIKKWADASSAATVSSGDDLTVSVTGSSTFGSINNSLNATNQGYYTLFVQHTDVAGNKSGIEEYYFILDNAAPTTTVTAAGDDNAEFSKFSNTLSITYSIVEPNLGNTIDVIFTNNTDANDVITVSNVKISGNAGTVDLLESASYGSLDLLSAAKTEIAKLKKDNYYRVKVRHTDVVGLTSSSMAEYDHLNVTGGLTAVDQSPAASAVGISKALEKITVKFFNTPAGATSLITRSTGTVTVSYGSTTLTSSATSSSPTLSVAVASDGKTLEITPTLGGNFNFPGFTEVTVELHQKTITANGTNAIPNEEATWKFTTEYIVTLDANGGSGTGEDGDGWTWNNTSSNFTKSFSAAVGTIGTLPTPTRDEHKFNGWFTAASGGDQITSTTASAGADRTYYAQWTEKTTISITETVQSKEYTAVAQAFGITTTGNLTNFTITYNQGSGDVTPINAGTYNVVILRAEDENYKAYSRTITGGLVITKKSLTIEGLSATNRVYDGSTTSVTLTGGTLSGVITPADNGKVSAEIPTTGTVSDANIGTNKAVTFTSISLTGDSKDNYILTQPTITVDITAVVLTSIGDIAGTNTKVGTELTAGAIEPVAGATVSYQWKSGGVDITGATNSTYTITASDIGKHITVSATGTGNYSGTVTSAATAIVYDEYTVTFNSNGGSGTMSPQIFTSGISQPLTINGFTASTPGYGFRGWATTSTGNVAYLDKQPVTMTEDITLYAVWGVLNYIVTLDANGGSGADGDGWTWNNSSSNFTKSFSAAVGTIGTLPTPTRTGYKFNGWFTAASGGDQITSTTASAGADIIYYAQWTEKTTITVTEDVQSKEYTAAAQAFDITATDNLNDFTITYSGDVTPINAGTYNVVISRAEDGDYKAYSTTITGGLVITKKSLTIEGLSATNRAYDNTNSVVLSGGALSGVILPADNGKVSAVMPTTGTVSDANIGTNKAVTFTSISLTGDSKDNYILTQPTITVDITAVVLTSIGDITGTNAKVGTELTAGAVAPAGATVSYQWKSGGVDITGATSNKYTLTTSDIGKSITVSATGTGNYSGTVTSAATATVYDEYTVTFDANGGDGGTMSSQTFTSGIPQALTANGFTTSTTGHVFRGWATTSTGAVEYLDGQTVTMTGNTTLYAVWGVPVFYYTVEFNSNGGDGTMSSQIFTSGISQALTTNGFTRTGYLFKGWATTSTGTVEYSDGESVTMTEGITLYAVWEVAIMNLSATVSIPKIFLTASYPNATDYLVYMAEINTYNENMTAADASAASGPGVIISSAGTHTFSSVKRFTTYKIAAWAKLNGSWVEMSKTELLVSIGIRKEGYIEAASGLFAMSEISPSPVAKGDKPSFEVVTGIDGSLEVAIYNLAGEKVEDVLSTHLSANTDRKVFLSFDDLASGTYTVVVSINGEKLLRQVVVTK